MSLKFALGLFLFIILATYLSYLNPQEVEFHVTNSLSFRLPLTVFLLASVLIGVFFTGILTGLKQTLNSLKRLKRSIERKKKERLNQRWEQLYQKAKNAFITGRQQKAVGLFEKILAEHPEHAGSLYHLGRYMRMEGKYDDAIELHQKAVQVDPENIQALYSLSEDFSAANLHQKEIQTLENILELDRNSLPTLRKLRDAHLTQENWGKAYFYQKSILPLIHDANELMREQDRFSQIVYSKGVALYKSGRLDSAIVEFKRSIRENNRSLPAYIKLGDIYLENKNTKAAIKIWKAGFTAARSPICLLKIQRLYEAADQFEEVVKLYKWAHKYSDNERLRLMQGTFLLQNGKLDEAINILENIQAPSLPVKLLTLNAWRKKKDSIKVEGMTRNICDQLMNSLDKYSCSQCGALREEWKESCPECLAWDSMTPGFTSEPNK